MDRATKSSFSSAFDQVLDLFKWVLRISNDNEGSSNNNNNNNNNNNKNDSDITWTPSLIRDERLIEELLEEETRISDGEDFENDILNILNKYDQSDQYNRYNRYNYNGDDVSNDDDDRTISSDEDNFFDPEEVEEF
ncbi:hypothetical protein Glove_9g284 [Diversispora epigaea]|uniref:Uncharacterized protein n=1 Tax=Diversispora epigaea TaxID=1348612 RepID=A0A397JNL4_9GLOM|nr:hypothetical protein Glove_9g284 [Diversispora epigaea]